MFVDPKVSYDINGNSSSQLPFQRQSVDASENFRGLKKNSSPPFSCLLDVGSSDQKRTWQNFQQHPASIIPSKLFKQKRHDQNPYQPSRWVPSFSPQKKHLDRFCFPPPRRKYQKMVPLEKKCGFFHGFWLFPSIPRGQKKDRVPRQWDLCGGPGSWMAISRALLGCLEKIGKGGKTPWQPWKTPGPETVFFYCKTFQHRPLLMNPNESHE